MNVRLLASVLALPTLTFLVHCSSDDAAPVDAPVDGGVLPAPTVDADAEPVDAATGFVVTGKVVSQTHAPVAGARVAIQGKGSVTDAKGTFRVEGVSAPYDVSVILDQGQAVTTAPNGTDVTVFAGLKTPGPILTVAAFMNEATAKVTGTVSYSGQTFPAGSRLHVLSMNELGPTFGQSNSLPTTPGVESLPYTITVGWPGDRSRAEATVFAISYVPDPTDGFPSFNPVIASAPQLTLSPDAQRTGHLLTARASPLVHVSGQISLPPGYTQLRRMLRLRGKESGAYSFSQDGTQSRFELDVPSSAVLEPPELGVVARDPATDALAFVWVPAVANGPVAAITFPPAPAQTAPSEQEAAVPGDATFSWTGPSAGCVYSVRISSTADGSTAYQVITTQSSMKLPDLSASQVGLAPLTAYRWTVSCLLRDTQDADKLVVLGGGSPDRGSLASGQRRFTTR